MHMYVVATSVLILFILIVLGFLLGKREVIHKESIPDLSNLVIMVTMPVTVFCSIIEQDRDELITYGVQTFLVILLMHVCALLFVLILVQVAHVADLDRGVWIYSLLFSNNGFMGLPLALSVLGGKGMFLMALGNVIGNFLIFSVGIKLLTWKYPIREKLSIKKMLVNNINIAVVLGIAVCVSGLSVPEVAAKLLGYLGDITSGLSMLVVGLSLSRMSVRAVFEDKKMLILATGRLLIFPLLMLGLLTLLPVSLDPTLRSVVILTAALPTSSAQSMITEQYGTNTAASGRSVFVTTLLSVVTVPLIMAIV